MKPTELVLVLVTLLLLSCDGPDVNNNGAYKFLPGPAGVDTAPYPLSTLLVVEEDAEVETTLLYLFEGELGRADLGIVDLRQLAVDFGFADIRFDFPRSYFRFGAGAGGEGGGAGAMTDPGEPAMTVSVDGEPVEMFEVTDAVSFELGVTRYLSAIRSTDWEVRAFWGRLEGDRGVSAVRSTRGELRFEYESGILPTRIRLSRNDEGDLLVEHDELSGADYKVVDLYQHIVRSEDGAEIDALMRTSYGVDAEFRASSELLSSVWNPLCWSRERPLFARVEQVERSYEFREEGGDFAVIHKRRDFARVPGAAWEGSAPGGELPSYCENYE